MALRGGPPPTPEQLAERTAGVALPMTARGRAKADVEAVQNRAGCILIPIVFGFMWLIVFAGLFGLGRNEGSFKLALFLLALIFSALLLRLWFWRQQKDLRKCAPGLLVEVQPQGISIVGPDLVEMIPYDKAAYTVTTWSGNYATFFLGIVLETSAGPIHLQDAFFDQGTDAAKAIVRLCGDVEAEATPRLHPNMAGATRA